MRTLYLAFLLCFPLLSFGQATPVVVADICPGGCSSNPSNLVEWNGKIYFFATSPTAGRELLVYDGNNASVVADIALGSADGIRNTSALTRLNNKLYFAANDTTGATLHYVYSYDGSNAPQKILLANGQPLRSRGALAAAGNDLLLEYNDTANRYRLAKYIPASGTVQIVSTDLYVGAYQSFGGLQSNGAFAAYGGILYSNSAKNFVCDLATGVVIGTPTSHTGRSLFGPDGVYHSFSDIVNVGAGTPGTGGTHLSRFRYAPFSWSMLTTGAANATMPFADRSAPALYGGDVYYAGLTTPGNTTMPAAMSLVRYDASANTATAVAAFATSGGPDPVLAMSAELNGILYMNYSGVGIGNELHAYAGGNIIRITDIDGSSAGFNPTAILSYNGDLLIAGTTSANGTELYRIAGTGLGLTAAQQTSAALLSPNPATSQLTIALPKAGRYNLRIISTTGQTLRTYTIQGASVSIPIEDLASGLYFAQITDATTGASASTVRFVKE